MKFRWKIFSMCMAIYIATLLITSILVTENTYQSLLKKEVERSLQEEKNMHRSAALYLIINQKAAQEKITIQSYSQRIADMFGTENGLIEIFDMKGKLLASNPESKWNFQRNDLVEVANNGRSYVLRRQGNKHFLFINDLIQSGEENLIFSYIKDITHIDEQKREQYIFFLQIGFIGLIIIIVVTGIASRFIIKPIEDLSSTAKKIASGDYCGRVQVKNKDEIGILGEQFNIMASDIEKRIDELKQESERKQRFTDNLTHELRTPLTSILGYSELLMKMPYDKGNFDKGLLYINVEGKRMLRLINTLMDMILLRENGIKMEEQFIKPLLKEAADIMQVKAKDKGILIEIDGTAQDEVKVSIDRDMIKGVLLNLLDNAIKASNKNDSIRVGIKTNGNSTIIFVRDKGQGMEEKEIKKILEPFYRIDKSRTRKEGGLGLGLAICNSIMEAHGGRLEIESKFGEGTNVNVVFSLETEVSA